MDSSCERDYNIERFYEAHKAFYEIALREMGNGYKINHWIWFIFPQLKALGHSHNAVYYGMENAEEARQYYNDSYLGSCLREITVALLSCGKNDPTEVMGYPDNLRVTSIIRTTP